MGQIYNIEVKSPLYEKGLQFNKTIYSDLQYRIQIYSTGDSFPLQDTTHKYRRQVSTTVQNSLIQETGIHHWRQVFNTADMCSIHQACVHYSSNTRGKSPIARNH